MTDYDAVVIGAGNGGLTAALTLAGKGLKVLLLERHNIPGGCATSFLRGRFEFEVALHQLSGMGGGSMPGPLRGMLAELGVLERLDFVQMDNLYRLVIPGSLDITLKADRGEATAVLKNRFPKEANNIERFFELLYGFCTEMVSAVFLGDPEASRDKYPVYCRYAFKSSAEVLDEFFTDPLLKAAVSIYWTYMGLPPSKMAFNEFATVLWAYLEFKPFHLKGGSQMLSSTLLDAFFRAGGHARFNCGVQKILVKNNRVLGVITETGEEVSATHIVSNAGTITTYIDLVGPENVPPQGLDELKAGTVGTSAFTVFLGFDCEPSDLGLDMATNFIAKSTDYERIYSLGKTLAPPEAVLFSCYDADDPTFSPAGACQAALVGLQYAEPWLSVPPTQYADTKYRVADAMLKLVEQVVPDLRSHIEEVDTASPLTHMRYLGHPGGAIYGLDQYSKDSYWFLPKQSPIEGLYCAGAWVGSGGFQPTLESGVAAAKAVFKSIRSRNHAEVTS